MVLHVALTRLASEGETGTLTPEVYVTRLKNAIAYDTKLAITLKRDNRIADATRVLKRIKTMKNEIVEQTG